MNELTDAQKEALKTLPPQFLAKLRAAVTQKRDLDEQWAAEEERVTRLRDMVSDWKGKHDATYKEAMDAIQIRLTSSEAGVSQSLAHVDRKQQLQVQTLDDQLARRRGEIEKIDGQILERQQKIDDIRAKVSELHGLMERKRALVDSFSTGNVTPRGGTSNVARRAAMTLFKSDGKAHRISSVSAPISALQTPRSARSPKAANPSPLLDSEEQEERPVNTPETAEPLSKFDIDMVPARVVLESLQEIILEPSGFFLSVLSAQVRPNEQEKLGRAWVEIFANNGEFMNMLRRTVEREVDGTQDIGTLFRSNSMASRMMSIYSRTIGMDYIRTLLKPKIESIIASKENLEIDTQKIEESAAENSPKEAPTPVPAHLIDNNITKLTEHAIDFIQTILAGKTKAPLEFYHISQLLKELVAIKFPSQWKIAIGGYIFLRLMCPCIFLPPDDFGCNFVRSRKFSNPFSSPYSSILDKKVPILYLPTRIFSDFTSVCVLFRVHWRREMQDSVAPESKRTLVLVSKILQNLANLQPKFVEEIMAPFSNFVTFNLHSVEQYFDFMASAEPPANAQPAYQPEFPIRLRLREVLALCSTNFQRLSAALQTSTSPIANEEFIQLWSFNKAPKLMTLYNKLYQLSNVQPYPEDSNDVHDFIEMIVPSPPQISPLMKTASRASVVAMLPLSQLTNPAEQPYVVLAVLETSTRQDFSAVENAELAIALFPIWEHFGRTPELIQLCLDIFVRSPTKSNRPLLDSAAAKVFSLWTRHLVSGVVKTAFGPAIANLASKGETISRREVMLDIAGNFLLQIQLCLPELPDELLKLCKFIAAHPRFGIPTVIEFIYCLIFIKALEDPEAYALPTAGIDRIVRKGMLMVADQILLVSTGARERQNAAVDSFLTGWHTQVTEVVTKWLSSEMGKRIVVPALTWNDVSGSLDALRVFLGKNMSSISAILESSTNQSRYVKFTMVEAIEQMIKHTAANLK